MSLTGLLAWSAWRLELVLVVQEMMLAWLSVVAWYPWPHSHLPPLQTV